MQPVCLCVCLLGGVQHVRSNGWLSTPLIAPYFFLNLDMIVDVIMCDVCCVGVCVC